MSEKNKIINLFDNVPIHQDSSAKYSDLLNDFIKPFEKKFPKDYDFEDVVEFSITTWNMAIMEHYIPAEEFKKMESYSSMPEPERTIFKQMLQRKSNKFGQYDRFISDFTFSEGTDGELLLTVATQEKEVFLADLMADLPETDFESQYQEGYINRVALTITPKKPFFDWLSRLYPGVSQDEVLESNVYLLEETIDEDTWIREKFDVFFQMELEEWHDDKKDWPLKRNFKMFREWFYFTISATVYDMEKEPVYKD